MRIVSFIYVSSLVTLLAQAAPVPNNSVRGFRIPTLPKISIPKFHPKSAPKSPPKRPATPKAKPTHNKSKSKEQKTTAAPTTTSAKKTASPTSSPTSTASSTASSIASSSASVTSTASSQSSATASSTSSAAGPNNTTTPDDGSNSTDAFCPIYNETDLADLEARDVALQKRVKEEYWFRWDSIALGTAGDILQLAPHDKTYDDQAYKWISTNAGKVTRAKGGSNRVATVYVLPAGTRDAILAAAQRFEDTEDAKKPADFVTKDHEPGDVGIQGVERSKGGRTPLDVFRNKVIRTVIKKTSTKGGITKTTYVTITKGKTSLRAEENDKRALEVACG